MHPSPGHRLLYSLDHFGYVYRVRQGGRLLLGRRSGVGRRRQSRRELSPTNESGLENAVRIDRTEELKGISSKKIFQHISRPESEANTGMDGDGGESYSG